MTVDKILWYNNKLNSFLYFITTILFHLFLNLIIKPLENRLECFPHSLNHIFKRHFLSHDFDIIQEHVFNAYILFLRTS